MVGILMVSTAIDNVIKADCIAILINGLRTVNEKNARDKMPRRVRSRFGQRRTLFVNSPASERAKHQRGLAALMVNVGTTKAQRARLAKGCTCVLIRLAPKTMHDESDSLRFALPHIRDGVADALEVDDRDAKHGGAVEWLYEQEHARGYGVRIEFRPRGSVTVALPRHLTSKRLPTRARSRGTPA
jgi:hypothetical protein